ncbi:hypothetical protein ON010_g18310 [Phytophthora cinnamomi]|nr:hypothetical protein ON010_g18310 [Phytophthora cinnamomi]
MLRFDYVDVGAAQEEIIPGKTATEELRREIQARYRERKHKSELKTEEDVAKLRVQIATLQRQHQITLYGAPTRARVWNIAVEYFEVSALILTCSLPWPSTLALVDFLRATMTPDVTDGNVHGIDAIVEQWRLYTLYHADLHMALERLERGPDHSVIATTKTSMTITENTLFHAFRHLFSGNCSFSDRGISIIQWKTTVLFSSECGQMQY